MEGKYIFREARLSDLVAIEQILADAVDRMLAEGKQQWSEKYPRAEHVLADMSRHVAYVLELDGKITAYGAVVFTGEPAYENLRGEWLSDVPYVVVHRLATAMDMQQRGIARRFLRAVEQMATSQGIGSFRIDTNYDNERMLGLLSSSGFEYCGDVSYETGSRLAFEKLI